MCVCHKDTNHVERESVSPLDLERKPHPSLLSFFLVWSFCIFKSDSNLPFFHLLPSFQDRGAPSSMPGCGRASVSTSFGRPRPVRFHPSHSPPIYPICSPPCTIGSSPAPSSLTLSVFIDKKSACHRSSGRSSYVVTVLVVRSAIYYLSLSPRLFPQWEEAAVCCGHPCV